VDIQWFPGHMAKTRRLIAEALTQVDGVVHLGDARVPDSSYNPLLEKETARKFSMYILAKSDLADPDLTKAWTAAKTASMALSLRDNAVKARLTSFIQSTLDREMTKRFARPWRVMVVGIPNVGKSTLINLLAGRRSAKVGDRPGITRSNQWIKISPALELLDTPGILWPKFDHRETAMKLAITGSIRDEILPQEEMAKWLLEYMGKFYPQAAAKFDVSELDIHQIGVRRGILKKGGEVDTARVAEVVIKDFRSGRLGRITLDRREEKHGSNLGTGE